MIKILSITWNFLNISNIYIYIVFRILSDIFDRLLSTKSRRNFVHLLQISEKNIVITARVAFSITKKKKLHDRYPIENKISARVILFVECRNIGCIRGLVEHRFVWNVEQFTFFFFLRSTLIRITAQRASLKQPSKSVTA